MEALEANVGGFVAPLTESNKTPPTSHFSWAPESTISIFGIEVASSHSFESFANQMHINEKEFLMSIHHIANKNSDHL